MRRWMWLVVLVIATSASAQEKRCKPYCVDQARQLCCGRICDVDGAWLHLGCPPSRAEVEAWLAGSPTPGPTATPAPIVTATPAPTIAPTVAPTAAPTVSVTCPDGELPLLGLPGFETWRGKLVRLERGRIYTFCVTVEEDVRQLEMAVSDKTGGVQCLWQATDYLPPVGSGLRPSGTQVSRDTSFIFSAVPFAPRGTYRISVAATSEGCSNVAQVSAHHLRLPPPGPGPGPTATPIPTAAPGPDTRTPGPTPAPTPTAACIPPAYRHPDCGVFGYPGACDCIMPTPRPATPTPARASRVAQFDWPADDQTGLAAAMGSAPGSWHAAREWWYAAPNGADPGLRAAIERRLADIAAGRLPETARPRAFLAEPAPMFWCVDVALHRGGFTRMGVVDGRVVPVLKPPGTLPETLTTGGATNEALAQRKLDLLAWGVSPTDGLMVSAYAFGCVNTLAAADQARLAKALEVPWPAGFLARPLRAGQAGCEDYPDPPVVALNGACAARFVPTLRGQHPEIGELEWQASNGCNAFGRDGHGYEVVGMLARASRDSGFPVVLQLEDRNCDAVGAVRFADARPMADCRMLCAIEAVRPDRVAFFWGPSWAQVGRDLEACAC